MSIVDPIVTFLNLKFETAICPLRTLVKIFLILLFELFKEIVYEGILSENGMSSFSDVLSENDVESIYHYIVKTASVDRQIQLEQNN